MPYSYVPVMTIAGSDSSGGAGIEADIKTISALGGYATAVITAVTAQNTSGVTAIAPVCESVIGAQIDAVLTDIPPKAVKIGMTGNKNAIETIAAHLAEVQETPIVVDPVMVSTSGYHLTEDDALDCLIKRLIPLAHLLTPNIPEAEAIVGHPITSEEEFHRAAQTMLNMGCSAVLIKGGHAIGHDTMTDRLYCINKTGKPETTPFTHSVIPTPNTHGTGCTLSSAIATYLAMGLPLMDAVEAGIVYLHQALDNGREVQIGHGHGPVNHSFNPRAMVKKQG